jgi:hypothetical protein
MKIAQQVYFIEAVGSGYIKIGVARSVSKRLGIMQIGCPFPLRLLATCEGGITREREIHRKFNELSFRGEWFHDSPLLRTFIRRFSIIPEPIEPEITMDELRAAVARIDIPCATP